MDHQADYPAAYPESDLELFETAPSLGAGVHRVRGAEGVYVFFVSIETGLPLTIHVGDELLLNAPAGSSVVSVLGQDDAKQAAELNRILETVLALSAPLSVTLRDSIGLISRLPVFDSMKGRVSP